MLDRREPHSTQEARGEVKVVPQLFQSHRNDLLNSALLQYSAGAWLCGSEKLLPTYWFDLGQKYDISMASEGIYGRGTAQHEREKYEPPPPTSSTA